MLSNVFKIMFFVQAISVAGLSQEVRAQLFRPTMKLEQGNYSSEVIQQERSNLEELIRLWSTRYVEHLAPECQEMVSSLEQSAALRSELGSTIVAEFLKREANRFQQSVCEVLDREIRLLQSAESMQKTADVFREVSEFHQSYQETLAKLSSVPPSIKYQANLEARRILMNGIRKSTESLPARKTWELLQGGWDIGNNRTGRLHEAPIFWKYAIGEIVPEAQDRQIDTRQFNLERLSKFLRGALTLRLSDSKLNLERSIHLLNDRDLDFLTWIFEGTGRELKPITVVDRESGLFSSKPRNRFSPDTRVFERIYLVESVGCGTLPFITCKRKKYAGGELEFLREKFAAERQSSK